MEVREEKREPAYCRKRCPLEMRKKRNVRVPSRATTSDWSSRGRVEERKGEKGHRVGTSSIGNRRSSTNSGLKTTLRGFMSRGWEGRCREKREERGGLGL